MCILFKPRPFYQIKQQKIMSLQYIIALILKGTRAQNFKVIKYQHYRVNTIVAKQKNAKLL